MALPPFRAIVAVGTGVALIIGFGAREAFLRPYGASKGPAAVADSLRCPSQYATSEEAAAAFGTFSNSYYTAHPGATTGEMLQARLDFYASHHCIQELQSYRQAATGQADKATMDMIDRAIRGQPETEKVAQLIALSHTSCYG